MKIGEYEIKPGADLRGANMLGANMRGANMLGADLRGANMRGANMLGANMPGADLRGANMLGADLRRADLRGANMLGADLRGEADLSGANLSGSEGIFSFGPMPTSGRICYAIWHYDHWMIQAGCFWGNTSELLMKVRESHKCPVYLYMIEALSNYKPLDTSFLFDSKCQ